MKRLVNCLVAHASELVLLVGAAVMAVGAGMVYLPVGFLVGGGLAVVGAVLSIWGEEDRK
ncbi:MAG: hypothetical protein RR295_04640 [Oscillospiraceae bacterium]